MMDQKNFIAINSAASRLKLEEEEDCAKSLTVQNRDETF